MSELWFNEAEKALSFYFTFDWSDCVWLEDDLTVTVTINLI